MKIQPHIRIRIPFGDDYAIGPGKADLLEAIARTGSISAAGRALKMSYRRAWLLVNTMNRCFKQPLVETATGGASGGGAQVNELGREVLRRFRAMESKAVESIADDLAELEKYLATESAAPTAPH
jgi:molybdate transport system regulatory protein